MQPGSPAALAGVRAGDVIVAVDGVPVEGVDDLLRVLDAGRIGREVEVRLLRRGAVETVKLVPGERG